MPKKLNIIFDAQNDARKNLVTRMAAAVSSGISCEQTLPIKWLICHLWNRSAWLHSFAVGYVACLLLGVVEFASSRSSFCGEPG